MIKSIRWGLLVWQAVLLIGVLVGFGTSLYLAQRKALQEELDAELLGIAQVLAVSLKDPALVPELAIPFDYRRRFGKDDRDQPHFVVWRGEHVYAASLRNEEIPPRQPAPKTGERSAGWGYHDRGIFREVILNTSEGFEILVGRSTEKQAVKLARLSGQIVLSGLGVLLIGLVGSWWLARRALRPIAKITVTAEAISASDLRRRIDVEGTESELGQLATVLNRTFARLGAAFERQARFAADASHELRTPVAVISTQAELALARERTSAEYRQALEACLRAAARMRSLVEELLLLARADAGQLIQRRERCDLRDTIESILTMLKPMSETHSVSLQSTLAECEVIGDPERFADVVRNLVENAILYNRAGGEIAIALEVLDGEAVLTVTDTGIGIAEEDQAKIFERFFRADEARSRERGGNGLGLAICKETVEAHGGTIALSSRLGEGTQVTVRLPRLEARGVATGL